jgi:hypothetical protein
METASCWSALRLYSEDSRPAEIELRESLETAVVDDWEELATSSVEDCMCTVVTVRLL